MKLQYGNFTALLAIAALTTSFSFAYQSAVEPTEVDGQLTQGSEEGYNLSVTQSDQNGNAQSASLVITPDEFEGLCAFVLGGEDGHPGFDSFSDQLTTANPAIKLFDDEPAEGDPVVNEDD